MASLLNPTISQSFSPFRALSFDCYGTLIDWESGLDQSLRPLISRLPESHELKSSRIERLRAFQKIKAEIQKTQPSLLYSQVLGQAYMAFAASLGLKEDTGKDEAREFAASIEDWVAFPDTLDALNRLKKHFRLAILSNVDNASFAKTLDGPLGNFQFDTVLTAEDIGSYKPAHRNFQYLLGALQNNFSIEKCELLHVAQSLIHDHVPTKELGISSVWIARGRDGDSGMGGDPQVFQGRVSLSWKFPTLGELADAVEEEFKLKQR